MASLLELMPKEEADKAIARGQKRVADKLSQKGLAISPEIFITAELGYYYGWEAIQAVRDNDITLDEMNVLLEGARKVWYTKLVEMGGVNSVSGSFKSQETSYAQAMQPYTAKAKVE